MCVCHTPPKEIFEKEKKRINVLCVEKGRNIEKPKSCISAVLYIVILATFLPSSHMRVYH